MIDPLEGYGNRPGERWWLVELKTVAMEMDITDAFQKYEELAGGIW